MTTLTRLKQICRISGYADFGPILQAYAYAKTFGSDATAVLYLEISYCASESHRGRKDHANDGNKVPDPLHH